MILKEKIAHDGNFLFKYRSYLPIILLVSGLLVFGLERYQDKMENEIITNLLLVQLAGLVICFLGLGIRIITIGYAQKNTSGRNTHGQVADFLNTTGMYSTVRHPLYLGNFFMWLGVAVLTMNTWFVLLFISVFWIYYERIMYAEEKFLVGKFGDSYLNWANQTNAFIPKLKFNKQPDLKFNWKKVLKGEKSGFLAVFLVFLLFDLEEKIISNGNFHFKINWLFILFIFSLVTYIVIKYLQKRTDLLKETTE